MQKKKNKVIAIKTLVLPEMTYSFNIIRYTYAEINKTDTKGRKQPSSECITQE